jgi:lipopolysaccharide transport system ATP-binding protein
MSSNEITIQVKNLSKCYNIYNRPQDRLKQSVVPRLQQLVGKPPNRYFHEFWALRDVSFDVRKGETVGIIGRNGSGKSTLLQIICGTLSPTSGAVTTRGRISALLELGSGFNPEFSGRENVYLNGAILGLSGEEVDSRFDDIAGFADIGEFIEHPVKMYSSGMVVRLAFAVQAMVDPDILIVDEALAVGDEKFQRKCFARLEELKSRGTSILFVSHSGPQIVELCERVLLLEHGTRLLYSQPLQAVRAYQKLIYAPGDEQKQLVQDYLTADQSGQIAISTDAVKLTTVPDETETSSDTFDPALVPDTTVSYPVQGAEILSFRILDMDERVVNCLTFGKEYSLEVSGHFLSDRERVYIGIHIRTISGLAVTGQRYPDEGQYIEQVQAGSHFRVRYHFNMLLAPGLYFSGGGIWAISEPICMHRIIDATMFRVIAYQKTNFLAYVDISSVKPIFEIS